MIEFVIMKYFEHKTGVTKKPISREKFVSLPFFGSSNLHSHPFGGSPHLLKKSWPVVPACPGLCLPEVKPSIFSLHFPHLK